MFISTLSFLKNFFLLDGFKYRYVGFRSNIWKIYLPTFNLHTNAMLLISYLFQYSVLEVPCLDQQNSPLRQRTCFVHTGSAASLLRYQLYYLSLCDSWWWVGQYLAEAEQDSNLPCCLRYNSWSLWRAKTNILWNLLCLHWVYFPNNIMNPVPKPSKKVFWGFTCGIQAGSLEIQQARPLHPTKDHPNSTPTFHHCGVCMGPSYQIHQSPCCGLLSARGKHTSMISKTSASVNHLETRISFKDRAEKSILWWTHNPPWAPLWWTRNQGWNSHPVARRNSLLLFWDDCCSLMSVS